MKTQLTFLLYFLCLKRIYLLDSFVFSSGLCVCGLVVLEESLLDKENMHVPNSYCLFSLKSAQDDI